MNENAVSVTITGDASGYVDALKQSVAVTSTSMAAVQTAVSTASAQSRDALGKFVAAARESGEAAHVLRTDVESLGGASHEASAHVGGLSGIIKEYRQEIRTESRMSRFLAGDIASMGIASKGAAGEVTMLVSALAFSGPMGLAVEAFKMVVKSIMEVVDAEKTLEKQNTKIWADAASQVRKFRDEINTAIMGLQNASRIDQTWAANILPMLKDQANQKQALLAATDKLNEAEEKGRAYVNANYQTESERAKALAALTAKQREEVERLSTVLDATTEKIRAETEELKRLQTADTGKNSLDGFMKRIEDAEKYGQKRYQAEAQTSEKLLQLQAQTLAGNEKLEAEYVAKIQAIDNNAAITATQREALKTAELMVYRKQLTDYAAEQAQKWADAEQVWRNANIKAELHASEAIKRFRADQAAYQLKRAEEVSKQETKSLQESFALAKSISSGIGQAFAGMIDGTMSVGKAFAEMAKVAVKAIIDIAIKSVEANAINAASGAAASQASIPIIGPILAIAAMASMEALVMGLLSSIPSSAGGLGTTREGLHYLHGGETVIPAPLASAYRRGAESLGSGGGGDTHNHTWNISTMDARSFKDTIREPAFRRAISDLVRTGEWAG